jgi:hypothetical protein
MSFQMNKQRGRHMSGGSDQGNSGGGAKHPHFAIHSHAGGHEVHITHPSGEVEHHHHELGDDEGIAGHIHAHIGNGDQRPENDMGQGEGGAPSDGLGV